VQAVDGGVKASEDDFDLMFEAPESGYESKFAVAFQKGAAKWTSQFIGSLYFTAHNGRCYGKLCVNVVGYRVQNGTVPVVLGSFLNPAGSRNLEIKDGFVSEAHP
jgi:hypothetical protein